MNESGTFTDAIHHCARAVRLSIEIAMDHGRAWVVSSARFPASDTFRLDPEAGLIGEELPLLNEQKFQLPRKPVRSQLLRARRVSDSHRTSLATFAATALESPTLGR
jgi:hypothetical protein